MFERAEIAPGRRRGRGASTNPAHRFDPYVREVVDDGWDRDPEDDLPPLKTEVRLETPKKVITRNQSPDISFDQSVNPYRGCEHGCVYCYARPSHGYLGLSAGLDFETRLVARPAAPELLAKELRRKGYEPSTIALGSNTDPYQPVEREHRIMRGILEVLLSFRHPVGIVTKGTLIERDIDILSDLAARGLTRVGVSVTTLDPALSRAMEPRVPLPARRLRIIEKLAGAGVQVRVMVAPIIPGLNDSEVEAILSSARDAGASGGSWVMLRLPYEVAPLFRNFLREHCPDRAERVMARVREVHGGKEYDSEWFKRGRGEGKYAELIAMRFRLALKRCGFRADFPRLRTDLFRVPVEAGDQQSLF